MKRSEVLKLIEGLFEIAPRFDNKTNAENLLGNLEQIGMLPPRYTGLIATGEKFNRKLHMGRDIADFLDWEPEDEKK